MKRPLRIVSLGAVLLALVPCAGPAPGEWSDLLAEAGPELKGWARGPIPPSGKLDPQSQWSIDASTGYLVCEGNRGHEWLRWDEELGDFLYHVEWRFTLVDRPKKNYNSGIYARNSADARVWHQAQTGGGSGGYIFGETPDAAGGLHRVNLSKQVKGKPVKPAGEWNTFEIRCQGKDMILTVNGTETCAWHDCEVKRGYVGVEAEGYRIEFRNVRIRRL